MLISCIFQATQANASVKSGAKCTKVYQKVTTASRSIYQCRRMGKKLVWKYIGKAPAVKPVVKTIWAEEFNSGNGTLPSGDHWTSLLGDGNEQLGLWRFGTGELEWNDPEAAATDGKGNLVISTLKSSGRWTSARYWIRKARITPPIWPSPGWSSTTSSVKTSSLSTPCSGPRCCISAAVKRPTRSLCTAF